MALLLIPSYTQSLPPTAELPPIYPPLSIETVHLIKSDLSDRFKGPALATLVRLGFHHCVGGCDGCLNLNNPDNFGLEDVIEQLENLYNGLNLSSVLSRADLWTIAAMFAVEKTCLLYTSDAADE